MNAREFAVLETLNIASTRHSVYVPDSVLRPLGPHNRFQATAQDIDFEFAGHKELNGDYSFELNVRQIGAILGRLSTNRSLRGREPLVKKIGKERFTGKTLWALTDAGIRVLSA